MKPERLPTLIRRAVILRPSKPEDVDVHLALDPSTEFAFVFALVLLSYAALAAEPTDADPNPALHKWFNEQYSKSGAWCCNVSDGHLLDEEDWRQTDKGYEVRLGGNWHLIPDKALRDPKGGPNPTGRAIIWYTGTPENPLIYCFAPGTQY